MKWRNPLSLALVATVAAAGAIGVTRGQTSYVSALQRERVQTLFPIFDGGKWGFIDRSGNVVIEPRFDTKSQFVGGMAVVSIEGVHGYVSARGVFTPMPGKTQIYTFTGGLARVAAVPVGDDAGAGSARFGYIDHQFRPVIHAKFDSAGDFSENRARAVPAARSASRDQRGRWGYIDRRGRWIIEPRFEDAGDFVDGRARVLLRDHWGYIDRDGRLVVEATFDNASNFSEGLAAVGVGGRQGYIDHRGVMVIEPQFQYAGRFCGGVAVVTGESTRMFQYIDRTGRIAFEGSFQAAGDFHNGLARVYRAGKWGYIDPTGRFAIEPRFDDAHDFRDGLAVVAAGGEWGYIDRDGEYVWRSR